MMEFILRRLPPAFGHYHEPYLGGGSVLLALQPRQARVGDTYEPLVNVLRVVRDEFDELLRNLRVHEQHDCAAYYKRIASVERGSDTFRALSSAERAARLIYLTKTSRNRAFRLNHRGQFDVPYGHLRAPRITNERALRGVHEYLSHSDVELTTDDAEIGLSHVESGDFVFLDPPLDIPQHRKLRRLCEKLDARGAKFIVTCNLTEFTENLWCDQHFIAEKLPWRTGASRPLSLRNSGSGLIVRNYSRTHGAL